MKFTAEIKAGVTATALLTVLALLPALAGTAKDSSTLSPAVALSAQSVDNGGILLVQIDTRSLNPPISDLRITFQERVAPVFPHPARPEHLYFALISIPYRSTPGPAGLELQWSDAGGHHSQMIPFAIVAGRYTTDKLEVDPKRVNPNKKDRERAQREQREVQRIYATGSMDRLWNGPFRLPLESDITSPFGNRRVFNGQLKSYHNGVDFRAPNGDPASAANSGTVRLAKNLFYSGNVVLIDHGTGIFSIYAHLDEIDVAAGQTVEKGQRVGLTGATGRVSGPHLHWGVKVNGITVNPLQFVEVMASLVE